MRNLYKIAVLALPGLFVTGCADTTIDLMQVDKPQNIADYEYLDAYGSLKDYVNRSAHPGFLLGTGVSASDYVNKGLVYRVTNANYEMVTAGNEMKYASIVNDKGEMNFERVEAFIEAAEAVGMQVYGHTLCWHEQQNNKYLNGLIAPKAVVAGPGETLMVWTPLFTGGDGESGECANLISRYPGRDDIPAPVVEDEKGRGKVYKCDINANPAQEWDSQFFIKSNRTLKEGDKVRVSFMYRCSDTRDIDTQAHGEPGSYHHYEFIGTLNATPEWQEHTWEGKISSGHAGADGCLSIAFNLCKIADAATLYIDDVVWEIEEAAPSFVYNPLISGGDAADGECENLIARYPGRNDAPAVVVDDELGTGKVFMSEISGNPANDWDSQFFIQSNQALKEGDKVQVSFRYRCSDTRNIATQAHGAPGDYHHYEFIGTLEATPEWQDFSTELTVNSSHAGSNGCQSIAFNLCSLPDAGAFYIDDVVWTIEKAANSNELTDEEKYDILDTALADWIKGMMVATQGKVKAWDVVNEALSDRDSGQSLKHMAVEANADCFYWQDYLGDDYVRNAVKHARDAYAEIEGADPADLKLFVNDYGLEGSGSQKVTNLISWINRWESDNETKIDGIGTQMHVTYATDAAAQARNEQGVIDMFKKLAATGKLIRITELDMGIKTSDDWQEEGRKTETVTLEEQKAMGEYYKFIIKQYFENIPVAQQYGICHWSQTDSPENSNWRKGEPVGLWNLKYQRKPAYGGFCEGLKEE